MAAARAALSGQADGIPKTRSGPVWAIRALRVARRGAVKARTAALNQLQGLPVSVQKWQQLHVFDTPLVVHVNVSPRQFRTGFVAEVSSALSVTGLPASQLCLEGQ